MREPSRTAPQIAMSTALPDMPERGSIQIQYMHLPKRLIRLGGGVCVIPSLEMPETHDSIACV